MSKNLIFQPFLGYFFLPNTIIIIGNCFYVTDISMCSVAQTAVLWLLTRTSGVQIPRCQWSKKENSFCPTKNKSTWPTGLGNYKVFHTSTKGFSPNPSPGSELGDPLEFMLPLSLLHGHSPIQ